MYLCLDVIELIFSFLKKDKDKISFLSIHSIFHAWKNKFSYHERLPIYKKQYQNLSYKTNINWAYQIACLKDVKLIEIDPISDYITYIIYNLENHMRYDYIPKRVTRLRINTNIMNICANGIFRFITHLYLGKDFNMANFGYILLDCPNLIYLEHNYKFQLPLSNTLKHLKFGDGFSDSITNNKLPGFIETLEFGKSFNAKLWVDDIPYGVKKVIFGNSFDQILHRGVLPDSVTHVCFGKYAFQKDIYMPKSIKVISILDKLESNYNISKLYGNLQGLTIEVNKADFYLIKESVPKTSNWNIICIDDN